MPVTIYEPQQTRREAAPLIEREIRALHATLDPRPVLQRVPFKGLDVNFFRSRSGVRVIVFDSGKRMMSGDLDPERPGKKAVGNFDPFYWVRGPWERSFGVPFLSYDPHWNDRVPSPLKRAIRKAASSPESQAAKHVVDLMTAYADVRFEDVIECTVNGGADAADHAGIVINLMRGPKMAAVVPMMMWVNGVARPHVLKAYIEAHGRMGVRRRHVRDILGSAQLATKFLGYIIDINKLSGFVKFIRLQPETQATWIMFFCQDADPNLDRVFPGGLAAFLRRCVGDPSIDVHSVVRIRSGLFD